MTIPKRTLRVASFLLSKSSCIRSRPPTSRSSLAFQRGQASLATPAVFPRPSSSVFPPSPPDHVRPDTSVPPASFLESADDEYNAPSHPYVSRIEEVEGSKEGLKVTRETTLLLNLLASGDTQRALTIKRELDELGVPLSRHLSFTRVALNAIDPLVASNRKGKGKRQIQAHSQTVQLEHFLEWWSLADLTSLSPCSSPSQSEWGAYSTAERILLIRPFSFSVLSQFILLSAQAGPQGLEHIRRGSALRCLVFYGAVSESVVFLLKLEEAMISIEKGELREKTGGRAWLWQMAVNVHYDAGREEVVKQLLDFAHRRGLDILHPSLYASSSRADMNTSSFFAYNDCYTRLEKGRRAKAITQSTLNSFDQSDRSRHTQDLAKELQIIKRAFFPHTPSHTTTDATERKVPKHFSSFVSRFLVAYGYPERARDVMAFIHRMRDMLFPSADSPPPPTAAISQREHYTPHRPLLYPPRIVPESFKRAWLAAELRTYLAIDKPLTAIKTLHYFVALDPTLASEFARVLKAARRPRKRALKKNRRREEVDRKAMQMPAAYVYQRWLSVSPKLATEAGGGGYKLWPNEELLTLGWRALLAHAQGETKKVKRVEVGRLYTIFWSLAKQSIESEKDGQGKITSHLQSLMNRKLEEDAYLSSSPLIPASTSTTTAQSAPHSTGVQLSTSTSPATYSTSVLPTPRQFHVFIVALSTSLSPRSGASVLSDMRYLGIDPGVQSWGALAGAYARSGDLRRCERALDVVDGVLGLKVLNMNRESDTVASTIPTPELQADLEAIPTLDPPWKQNRSRSKRRRLWTALFSQMPSPPVVAAYNSSIRGFSEAGCFSEAIHIVERMMARGLVEREAVKSFLGQEIFSNEENKMGEDADGTEMATSVPKKQKLDPHTRATLSRLARYIRQSKPSRPFPSASPSVGTLNSASPTGPSPSALLRSRRRFYIVDGRRLFIDVSRVEWLAEQGKRVGNFRGG